MTADDERRKRFKSAHATDDLNGPSEYELHLMEEEAAKKEKRMMKLIGEHVVQSMNKYKEMMDHETFKRYAKEVSCSSADECPSVADNLVHPDSGGQGEARLFLRQHPASDPK